MTKEQRISEKMMLCPFCGSEAELTERVKSRGSNYYNKIPEGAQFVGTKVVNGGLIVGGQRLNVRYYWEKKGFVPRCTEKGCICRTLNKVYDSEEAAIDAWNRRDY